MSQIYISYVNLYITDALKKHISTNNIKHNQNHGLTQVILMLNNYLLQFQTVNTASGLLGLTTTIY